MRRSQCREPPLGRADARVPRRPDRRQRPLQRRLDAPVEPFDPARLEVDAAERRRLDPEPRVLEPLEELLPLVLRGRRVLLDERELRAERESLSQPHPRLHARRLGRSRNGAEHGLLPRPRPERRGPKRERRPLPKGRPQLESGDEKTRDHLRTYVLHEHTFDVKRDY